MSAGSLEKLLKHYPFSDTTIDEEVEITFPEEDSSTQGGDSELTNTDLESIDKEFEQAEQSHLVLFALNKAPDAKDSKWNYLEEVEIAGREDQASWHRNLSSKLEKDAFRIANAHKHARTRESTTCLCVVY